MHIPSLILIFLLSLSTSISAQEEKDKEIKIMTYNIWNGFDWGKDTLRKANCIEWIKSKSPDVLALQELCGYDEAQLKKDALQWGHAYVQILKTEGYPTGLTSNQPIQLKEKALDGFWHGLLHCRTYDIDFFIVHLSPADSEFRLREARLITERIKKLESDSYIILGDFNSFSPMDAYFLEKNKGLRERYAPKEKAKYSNLHFCLHLNLCLSSFW